MNNKIACWLSILLCVIPVKENSSNSGPSDSCLGYSFTPPTTPLEDCIDFISRRRNITVNHTRSIVDKILRFYKENYIDPPHHATSEGYALSLYANNPYYIRNFYGDPEPCEEVDDAFCKRKYNPWNDVNTSEIFKLCLIFCSRPPVTRTPSSNETLAMPIPSTIIPGESTKDGKPFVDIWIWLIVGFFVGLLIGIILTTIFFVKRFCLFKRMRILYTVL